MDVPLTVRRFHLSSADPWWIYGGPGTWGIDGSDASQQNQMTSVYESIAIGFSRLQECEMEASAYHGELGKEPGTSQSKVRVWREGRFVWRGTTHFFSR